MNKTTWIIISVLCVLGLSALIIFTKKDAVNVDNLDPNTVVSAEEGAIGDRIFGKADAKVIVFEYADFQCPGCAGAHPATQSIQQLYKDQVAFVYRNFPLTSAHPNALAAASAAEAAGQQNKFWEMVDLLFTNQNQWASASLDDRGKIFESYAEKLELNIDTWRSDQTSKVVQDKIARDRALGARKSVDSTPSFFVGSSKMSADVVNNVIQNDGALLMDKIDEALRSAGETPPTR